ncbi:unnamed protein product [Adineta ricciae]|uniref:Uncharacterized protein n=1 Tax=Adineta ricciae TaxID=249248 RepID=A0A815Q1L6_ADIRI|nr:unnamed protein product [Adineta ricciae]CAF1457017.1 unnamed protein product [Adineta ricciae]
MQKPSGMSKYTVERYFNVAAQMYAWIEDNNPPVLRTAYGGMQLFQLPPAVANETRHDNDDLPIVNPHPFEPHDPLSFCYFLLRQLFLD